MSAILFSEFDGILERKSMEIFYKYPIIVIRSGEKYLDGT